LDHDYLAEAVMNYVVLSADKHPDYQFLLPLTCILWATRTKLRPLAITAVETPALKFLSDADLIDVYLLNEIENDRLAIKLHRWYSYRIICDTVYGDSDDTLLLQDVDIWPIDSDFWNRSYSKPVTCHYGDAFQGKRHCTSGFRATSSTLREICPTTVKDRLKQLRELPEDDERRHSDDAAQSDLVLKWMKANPDSYELIERGPSPPKNRIDRSNWTLYLEKDSRYANDLYVDAHLPRDASDRRVWKLIEPLFNHLAPEWAGWAATYRKAWERTNQ